MSALGQGLMRIKYLLREIFLAAKDPSAVEWIERLRNYETEPIKDDVQ